MRSPKSIAKVLQNGGFSIHHYVGQIFNVSFYCQCILIAAFAAISILIGSILDGTLILEGRNIGLLEHPGIWVFIGLQVALPISIRHSLKKLLKSRPKILEITKLTGRFSDLVISRILAFLRLETKESRGIATIIYGIGIAVFVWNTYQNQLPGIIVPYDFWDSKTFFWGFWICRIYKFYLYVWLFPYLVFIHVAIIMVVLRFIRQARLSGQLKLLPFHPDGLGGLGFVPNLVTTPIIITLLMGSISTAAAFEVHRATDVTPLIGLILLLGWTGGAYIVPTLFLRSDIVALKKSVIEKLRKLQQEYYSEIIEDKNINFETFRKGNEALDYFEKVSLRVQLISNYPHLRRFLQYVSLAITPSVISIILKFYFDIIPIIDPALKKP
jgi:hypothetical protein